MNDEKMLLLYMADVKLKIQIYNGCKDLRMITCCSEILEIEEGAQTRAYSKELRKYFVILINICLLFYNFLIIFSIPYSLNSVLNSILVELCFQSTAEMILVQIWSCRFGVLNIFIISDSLFLLSFFLLFADSYVLNDNMSVQKSVLQRNVIPCFTRLC
jgi:hypothetical protein